MPTRLTRGTNARTAMKIETILNWIDNSWISHVLFLLLLVLCFLLFWVATPSGMNPVEPEPVLNERLVAE